jgi:quinol-cytochrome oxidoreductase complex cytochrome b subunit
MATGKHGSGRGETEGYLAVALTALLFVVPFLPTALNPFKTAMGLTILVAVGVLSVHGISRGRGGGKVAAWLSVAVLSFTLPFCAFLAVCRMVIASSRP